MESDDMITLDPTGHYRCPWYIHNSWCFWSPQRECSWSCTAKAATEEFVALVRRTAWGRWALLDLTWFDWFTQCDVYLHLQPVALPNFSWLCEVSFHNFHVKCVRHGALEAHRVYVIESEVTLSGMENHCSLPICWTCPRNHLWVPGGLTSMGKSWRAGNIFHLLYFSIMLTKDLYRQKSAKIYDDACYVYPHMQKMWPSWGAFGKEHWDLCEVLGAHGQVQLRPGILSSKFLWVRLRAWWVFGSLWTSEIP